jgi:hypothetical protein
MNDDPDPSTGPTSSTAICTLFEGDYHLGLAAFVNSLAHSGYRGTVWAGYRGKLPPWLNQLRRLDAKRDEYVVADQIRLVFLPLETDIHLANYKPQLMLDLLANQASECDYLWYFDPDIFLRCNWSHFARWQRHGIALCEEIVNYHLSESDPLRYQWRDIGTEMGLGEPRALNRYFNSGMVGVAPSHVDLLRLWKRILGAAGAMGIDMKGFMPGDRAMPFHSMDQDALNMAAMYTAHPLTTLGPEGMGFIGAGFTMYHAVGAKPWRGSLLLRTLAGIPPTGATKFFFTQVSTPIRAYSRPRLFFKRLACMLAAFIGRFYARR